MVMFKRVVYILGVVALLLGLYGFFSRLAYGERDVNYGSYVNWGLWVAMYLFFAGMAAGSFMVAALDYLFRVPVFRGTGKYALWGALSTLPFALLLIGFDLGRMERIWKVYLQPNPSSLMAQLVWSYTIFLIIAVVAVFLSYRAPEGAALRITMAIGFVVAIFVSGGVGALLGVNAARESLHAAMLPAQFPVLNFTAGIALLLAFVGFFGIVPDGDQRARLMRLLSLALVALLVVKAYFLWVDYSQVLYGSVPATVQAAEMILFGTYAWAFWGLQVLLGIVVPIIVLLQPRLSRNGYIAGAMAMLVLLGLAVGRTAIIFPAFAIPELEGLAEAFQGPHLGYDYVPSMMEWSVTIGVVGLSTLAFLVGIDRLPFLNRQLEVTQ
jgi:protein NrfD